MLTQTRTFLDDITRALRNLGTKLFEAISLQTYVKLY